jgi:hypothetical protein
MDRRAEAELALLEGYLSRHHGLVGYIDESFQKPIGFPARGFYIMAASIFHGYEVPQARKGLLVASASARWHTTDQYHLRNLSGIQRVASEVGHWMNRPIVVMEEFGGATDLEFSRKKCMYELMKQLESLGCSMIVYERRSTRFQINSDTALISKLVSSGYLSRSTRILSSSPAAEVLLWAPDLLAWAIRRLATSGELQWLQALGQSVELVAIQNPSEPQPKKKRPGPALAYPGPGPSVDHKGEGISRSSSHMFAYNKAFGQALTQLLVVPRQPTLEPTLARKRLLELFPPRIN